MIVLTCEKQRPSENRTKKRHLPPSEGGRRGCKNPQRFAIAKLIRYDQQAKQQCKTTLATKTQQRPFKSPRAARRSRTVTEGTAGLLRLSLTLPKCYLATLKKGLAVCIFWLLIFFDD